MIDVDLGDILICLVVACLGLVIGVAIGEPSELDNGCIVYGSNVYCINTEVAE